jgi:hypothetical protein
MKKQIVKAVGGAFLAILVLAVFAPVRVPAQGQNQNEPTLVGSWNVQVTLRDCQSGTPFVSFPAMMTYNQGGTIQQTAPPEPGAVFLPGHGVWSHQTGGGYSGAFQFFSINPNGTVATRTIVRSAISLGRDGNSYASTDTAETLNANGDLLFRACSTSTATRFE